jgi:Asp-tRNA(Asn)/Glu-tRNA(Gln) amidotransferase C subunit
VATEAENAWREDVPAPGLVAHVALNNAPLARHNQSRGAKVIE